jgi:hypothetical protein
MQSADTPRDGPIPDHVPEHLVASIDWYGMTDLGSDPFVELAKLHDGEPILYLPSNIRNSHGSWLMTREADIRAIVMDTNHFTSENISGFDQVIEGFDNKLIPTEVDPPDHAFAALSDCRLTARDNLITKKSRGGL